MKHSIRSFYKKHKNGVHSIFFIGCVAVLSIIFSLTVIRIGQVQGPSMENTLKDKQLVFIWQLGYVPAQGDIVITDSKTGLDANLIKRVVAVGGQDIKIQDGMLYIDGKKTNEKYLKEQQWHSPDISMELPEETVFLMGDNRNHSKDSRDIGWVSKKNIIGKVLFVN